MPDYSPAQDGFQIAAGWNGSADYIEVSGALPHPSIGGLVFACSGSEILTASLALTAHASSDTGPLAVVEAWLVAEETPADYSDAHLPGNRSEIRIGEAAFGPTTTIVLGQTPRPANAAECAASLATLNALTQNASWSHRLAITLETEDGSALRFNAVESGATAAALQTTESEAQAASTPSRSIGLRFPDAFTGGGGILGPRSPFE